MCWKSTPWPIPCNGLLSVMYGNQMNKVSKTDKESVMENKELELQKIRKDLKEMIARDLALEDIKPEEIGDDEILFGEGLGLDSLDAVEIVVLLQRNFGVEIKNMDQGKEIFYSINTIANYIYDTKFKES